MVLYRHRQKYAFQMKYFKKKKREKPDLKISANPVLCLYNNMVLEEKDPQ